MTVMFFAFAQPAFAQSQIVELFVAAHCAPNEVAEDILQRVKAKENTSGVLALTCDLAHPWCKKRRSLYTGKKILRRYSTPSSVVNGRYDVLAYDERIMRSALAMVRSTMSLPRIFVQPADRGVSFTLPVSGGERYYTPWVVVYHRDTTAVVSARALDVVYRDKGADVCRFASADFDINHGVAVFLHKPDGEIAAVGNYAGDR